MMHFMDPSAPRRVGDPMKTGDECTAHCVTQETHLDFGLQDDVGISRITQSEDAPKLIRRELANVPNFEFWGLKNHGRGPKISWD